jgi:hypothetical protein
LVSLGHIALLHNKGATQIQVETRNTHHRREFFRVQYLGFLWGTLPLIMISVTYLADSLSLSLSLSSFPHWTSAEGREKNKMQTATKAPSQL